MSILGPKSNQGLAPAFSLTVSQKELDIGVTQLISSVEYESSDGIADALKVTASNPKFVLTDRNVFMPGNEISVSMGYGPQLKYIGRAIISKVRPNYPQDGNPTIQIVAYTKDAEMMDHSPEKPKPSALHGKRRPTSGRKFAEKTYAEAVADRAGDYEFAELDIDPTEGQHTFIQKSGMSDYEFVKGLANLTGYVFWVDGDTKGKWTLHFRNPEKALEQELVHKYTYNSGDFSTLLEFEPEFLIRGFNTKITVQTKDPISGKILETTLEEQQEAPDQKFEGEPDEELEGPQTSGAAVKLFFQDFSFQTVANKRFKTEADVKLWAQQWFRRQRENFVLSRGKVMGDPSLMARQIHFIDGIGKGLNGDYYFNNVNHKCDASGYICDFNARKVVK